MKEYNEVLLKNKWILDRIHDWAKKTLLSDSTKEALIKEYADVPYKPHWFVWIGLFIFTLICISSGGIVFLPFVDVPGSETFFPPLYGIVLFFFLNYLIKQRKLYFSGVDNALLYSILFAFLTPIFIILSNFDLAPWIYALCSLPVFFFLTYRYGEPVIALGLYLIGLFILASLAMYSSLGKLFLPFIAMGYAGVSGYFIYQFLRKDDSYYWEICLNWVQIASLVLFYLGGNYGVVREGNAALSSIEGNSIEIPFSFFFWFLTISIPALYIYLAFRLKDLKFLIIGCIALVASLATLQHYFGIIPVEWAITLLGIAGIGIAIGLMRYFSISRLGFAYAREKESGTGVFVGNIIAMQVSGSMPDQPQGTEFGGGEFGGGGSGEAY